MNTHTVLITGAAGYVGAMLVRDYANRSDVARVIGLDMKEKPDFLNGISKLEWIQSNTADNSWQEKAKQFQPDIVVHTAWQIRDLYGKEKMQHEWNIGGSDQVFSFVFGTDSVKRFIYFSTVSSYAAYPDNEIDRLFTEEDQFRESDYRYAKEKRTVEERLKHAYLMARSEGKLTPRVFVLRPAAITGPRGRYMRVRFGLQSALSGQLTKGFVHRLVSLLVSYVPATDKWCRQFVHEDDVVNIVTLCGFGDHTGDFEIFNMCPPGPVVKAADMAQAVGKKTIKIHPQIIRVAFFVLWHLTRGRVPTSRGGWKQYSYPIAVTGSRITRKYGYTYLYESKKAFSEIVGTYASFVKK
jgi:nucleoside-diphosphate-sugar epimerase